MTPVTAPERARSAPTSAPGRGPDVDRRLPGAAPAPRVRGPRWSLARTAALCGVIVLVSLLTVVAASAYLTQGQVRLTRMQGELTAVLGRHHDLEWQMASLTDPSRVVSKSENHGLVAPSDVTDLTQVTPTSTAPPAGHGPPGATGP